MNITQKFKNCKNWKLTGTWQSPKLKKKIIINSSKEMEEEIEDSDTYDSEEESDSETESEESVERSENPTYDSDIEVI